MPDWKIGIRTVFLYIGLLLPILFIHYELERSSAWLIPAFVVAFIFYILLYKKVSFSISNLLLAALLLRLLLFFGAPSLSDDYYRFLWDGQLSTVEVNPYVSPPDKLIHKLPDQFQELYDGLNSTEYHSTYPPLSQYIFSIPSWIGIQNVFWSLTAVRLVLLLFELGAIWLLFLLSSSVSKVLLYAFNPLVVLELTGNLHFEGVVVFFILLAWWLFQKERWLGASTALSLGILTKLTPLMFLPVLLKKLGVRKAFLSNVVIVIVLVMLSFPLLNLEIIQGLFNGLDLFFRKFEFNAGIFFLIREIGFLTLGYDVVQTVGPRLSYIAFALIILYSLIMVDKNTEWSKAFTIILLIQLLFATTVHPWYIIPLVAFSCITGYAFPIVWSLLSFLSYLGYQVEGYEHPMIWIAIEYAIVGLIAGYEIVKQKPILDHV